MNVQATTMSTNKRDQDGDDNMEDIHEETISTSINIAHEAQDAATDPPATASTSQDPINNFANDEQSDTTHKPANPVTEVDNNDRDHQDGSIGEDSEQSTPEDLMIRDENIALKHQVAVLENEIGILKGERDSITNAAHVTTRELRTIITNQHGALDNANNRITAQQYAATAAHNRDLGQRYQLDSLYTTLARQRDHLNAQAAYINNFERTHNEKLRRIRREVNKMVRLAVQRFNRQAAANVAATRRFAVEVDRVIFNQVEDPEATEDEEEDGVEEVQIVGESDIEIIDLIDEDDGAGDQVADDAQPAVVEQLDQVQQVVDDEEDAAIQQPTIVEQHVDDTTQVDASEDSPSKRIRLTEPA